MDPLNLPSGWLRVYVLLTLCQITAMGRVPDALHHLCLRGLPRGYAWLLDNLRELLLGTGTGDSNWRYHVHAEARRRVCLSNPLRPTVDVASTAHHRHLFRPGIALVACPEGETRRGEEVPAAVDEPEP